MSNCVMSSTGHAAKPWEPTSFDAEPHPAPHDDGAAIRLPTIEQITAIEEQARQEGYAGGHAEGLAAGRAEAAREAARLRGLAAAFSAELQQVDETVSRQILDLALDFSRALLSAALAVQPERVIPIVKQAVRYLPVLQQPALLFLHPDDVRLVRDEIGDELDKMGWQLAGDPQMVRGGCRVETGSNQIDATLPTRWQRLTAALSQHSDWLAA